VVGITVKEVVRVKEDQKTTIGRIPIMISEARRLPGSDPCVTITELSVERREEDAPPLRTWSGYPFVSLKGSHGK
jgi:hypothetical protein